MRQEQLPLYAVAAVVLVGGLIFAGVSPIFLLLLACPLMMMFMMRGMGGMDHGGTNHGSTGHDHDQPSAGPEDHHDHHDTSGR